MKRQLIPALLIALIAAAPAGAPATGFTVKAKGTQSFTFADKAGRNQVIFFSQAPLENITGTSNGISGSVSFDPAKVEQTIQGTIAVEVKTLTTGIAKRDEHMLSKAWLDAATFPTITFTLAQLKDAKIAGPNKISGTATGAFTLHGVTKSIAVPVTLTYMEESEKTKTRAPGDLLLLQTKFTVTLADYNITDMGNVIGSKLGETLDIDMNVVGSNGMK